MVGADHLEDVRLARDPRADQTHVVVAVVIQPSHHTRYDIICYMSVRHVSMFDIDNVPNGEQHKYSNVKISSGDD